MENTYNDPNNSENENISSTSTTNKSILSKKEHFRSKMKTQLIIGDNISIKHKLRTLQTMDFSNANPQMNDEFYIYYEELEKIGEGSHSIVKKCLNKVSNKIYAVKIIRTDDIEIINQAKSEFEIVKDLNHSCIIKFHEMFVNQKTGYVRLVTEYSEKKNSNKYLSELISVKITQQLLSALSFLHSNNIVHRDIKPSNILVHPESFKVTLIDFGISRFFNDQSEMCTPTGTPLYKAPEMIKGDLYNQNTDCWSLGVTLFEMLTGQKPFSYSYREIEMILNMQNQSFLDNQKYKSLSQTAQEFLQLFLNPDNTKRIKPQDALKHSFITRIQNQNQIICEYNQNIPQAIQQNQQISQQKISNQEVNFKQVSPINNNVTKKYVESNKKSSHSFTDGSTISSKELSPLKNNKNILNYSPQTKKSNFKNPIN